VCLFLSLSLLASVGGYALYGWLGALTGLGLAWATVGIALAVTARSAMVQRKPEPTPQIAVPVPQVAYGQPFAPVTGHAHDEPDRCEDDESPSLSSRATLPLAALALGAATFIGPVRAYAWDCGSTRSGRVFLG